MTAVGVVWGVVLIVGGLALARWGLRALRTRPGWGGVRGRGSLVTTGGVLIAAAGVVNLVIAIE